MARLVGACITISLVLVCMGSPMSAEKPIVSFKTSMGDFTIELEPQKAPKTVANFLQYVRDGYYDGTIFHRVINKFMIQGGGFTKELKQKPTRPPIINEANTALANKRGTIAMARTGDPHSATAQFFINVVYNKFLDHVTKNQQGWGYTAFGRVIDGMNIIGRIARVETENRDTYSDVPIIDIVIEKASITSD